MKTFAQYLTESVQTFDYRIKIIGDLPPGFIKDLKEKLKKFDPVSVSDPKSTPILSKHPDFPDFANEAVSIIDATFKYPATPPQLEQMVKLMGLDPNRVAMVQKDYADGMDKELMGIADQTDLLTRDLPAPDAEQKKLKKDYSAPAADKQVVKNSAADAKFVIAGGKTPPAVTSNDLPMGIRSPMTAVKRPPKPATGFQK